MRERLEVDYVSWLGDLAYGLGILAFVMLIVGAATPAWVSTEADTAMTLPNGKSRADYVFSRGLFNALEFDGYAQYTIIPFYVDDANGTLADPFCGSNDTVSSLPLLRQMSEEVPGFYRGRRYNSHGWCEKRKAASVFAVFTCLFAFSSVIATSCAQKGLCNQTPFIISIIFVFFMGLITLSIMGGFIDQENRKADRRPIDERFFPFEQQTVGGYSLIVFAFGVILYVCAFFLAIFEKCCHEGKVEGGMPTLKLEASKA
ncbi:hypothetical protein PTSG_05622 [Salpingoeca rosetta]|uniref:Uncharacterized protein n=1 Tax=Salpingoeca rosetta (strain ATCC 50818 / BSB-021) TaxID=946362 RepID=F2UBR0_SALR5|nr:uncharacterized protein PTSG_05622 [Salpingoeca rosetta]EGD73926.1 hypothetical protein PTSG_05622 [Salpingoeca rosetta]|eukprot:XP_004993489.1 hypothetical protein PTSG_05622 [Salpingoeca rosetta]